ncbi:MULTISPECIES: acyltransferase family protein [unclassified Pseudomonas]|uniref:acyltransferase family protein n=1 Tax=unclassified Pseudomonas TaxID=196821 RepID=UPI0013049BE3|nr:MULTISPECIES: acyltransferase family protein [unclassified Pseudomonas]
MHSRNTSYRPDIDGLRAIAVILVLLFHFGLGVPGGFVGVDVFFVISGFLITEVIKNSIEKNRFTFFDFYARRLLRLHPALIATIALCLGAGYLLMDPASFSTLASASSYAIFSASNFYFWIHQGYFDADALTQPLLHTWSLAAEWQFYVVWPFVVWASLKVSPRFLVGALVAMTVVSLAASQWMLSYDSSAAYFMMPFRVFELSIGALLVFINNKRASKAVESCILLIGVALIVSSAFILDSSASFPGLRALVPCLGAAACIYSGQSQSMGAALRFKPVVYIGLISYSAYLIHWPLIVFYKYYIFRELNINEKISLFLLALIAGSIMHHTIEKVFISKDSKKKIIGLCATILMTSLISLVAYKIVSSGGYSSRTPEAYKNITTDPANFHIKNYGGYPFDNFSKLGSNKESPDAYLVGDSFALQYASGIDETMRANNIQIAALIRQGCYLSESYTKIENGSISTPCLEHYRKVIETIKQDNKPVIFTIAWPVYKQILGDRQGKPATFKNDEEYNEFIVKNMKVLREQIGSRTLIIIGVQPYTISGQSAASCLLRPRYIHQPCDSSFDFMPKDSPAFTINKALRAFAIGQQNTEYIDPAESLCPDDKCRKFRDGNLIYSDIEHLSIAGSKMASTQISPILIKAIKK